MDNINPLPLYSSLIFFKVLVHMFGVGCCAPKLSSNVPTCPPGKFGIEERRCILPPLLVRQRKVRCVIKVGEGAGEGCPRPCSWRMEDPGDRLSALATSFPQHAGSTDLESALGGCPQRNGDCQSLKTLPPSFPSHAFRKEGRGNQEL